MYAREKSVANLREFATYIQEVNERLDDMGYDLYDDALTTKFDTIAEALNDIDNYFMSIIKAKEATMIQSLS